MKYGLLSIGLLVANCSAPSAKTEEVKTAAAPAEDPAHAAVTALLQKKLNGYVPVRWFPSDSWTRHDSLDMLVAPIKHGGILTKEEDAYVTQAEASAAFRDSTRLGTWTSHTYRFRTSHGDYLLDSNQFVVYKNGKVQPLYQEPSSPLNE
jgi:hypothetical protein